MGPGPSSDGRLPLSASFGLFRGVMDMFAAILTGKDPIEALKSGLWGGIQALGVDAMRKANGPDSIFDQLPKP